MQGLVNTNKLEQLLKALAAKRFISWTLIKERVQAVGLHIHIRTRMILRIATLDQIYGTSFRLPMLGLNIRLMRTVCLEGFAQGNVYDRCLMWMSQEGQLVIDKYFIKRSNLDMKGLMDESFELYPCQMRIDTVEKQLYSPFLYHKFKPKMHQNAKMMPIAIVGMGGRFPGEAHNPEKLWDMMVEGRDAWTPIPSTRFNHEAFYHPDPSRNGSSHVKGGFFLKEDLGLFDAPFFNITKSEAAALDPQQRLLLECTYEAFEDAGIPMASISGAPIGVFVGSFCKDWTRVTLRDPDAVPMYQMSGSEDSLLANRLSYFFNLSGPSMLIGTACSSTLVALHLACTAIRAGDCRGAVVAGANALLDHDLFNTFSTMRLLSPDGRSYTHDSRANGYGRGEGAAALVLKPLADALRDGDCIRAVIRNTGCNSDGRTPGISFPSAIAQASLLRRAQKDVGLDPRDTTYAECHGTGTQAGDPIETSALSEVFCEPSREQPLIIGSVKTNIGHLEGAAGVAGLVKTVMMLKHQTIVPNAVFQNPNERIPFEKWKLEVPRTAQAWKPNHMGVIRASISGFGYGGTNACAILDHTQTYLASLPIAHRRNPALLSDFDSAISVSDGYHTPEQNDDSAMMLNESSTSPKHLLDIEKQRKKIDSRRNRIFSLSAFDPEAGSSQASRLASYLEARSDDDSDSTLADLAYTLNDRRSLLPYRAVFIASTRAELIAALQISSHAFTTRRTPPGLAFVFTGQGAAWYAMGRELLDLAPSFARSLARCDSWLQELGADWCTVGELSREEQSSRVGLTRFSQPVCTAVQIALVDLLSEWGIIPSGVVGHSSGEIAAAYAAGLISARTAISIAYFRGVVSSRPEVASGGMAAVAASESEVCVLIDELRTHSEQGPTESIDELVTLCKTRGAQVHKLPVNVAYHSRSMQAVADDYRNALLESNLHNGEPLVAAKVPMFSSVSGDRLDEASQVGADYWVDNLVRPVRFSDALSKLCYELSGKNKKNEGYSENGRVQDAASVEILVEIGPHAALAGPIRQILQAKTAFSGLSYLSVLRRREDAHESALKMAAALYEKGFAVNLSRVNQIHSQAMHSPPSNGVSGEETTSRSSSMSKNDLEVDHKARNYLITGLPSYPWNHSTRYWAEPRESQLYRMRKETRHDLLGAIVCFNNPLEPRWRNWMRVSELPWLRHHRVQGLTVYPAAGYLCMAIEAARQHAATLTESVKGTIGGFEMREVVIGQALIIPDSTDEVETMLTLRPSPNRGSRETGTSVSHVWSEFSITSCGADGKWSEHCRGRITVHLVNQNSSDEVSGDRLSELERDKNSEIWHNAGHTCIERIKAAILYDRLTAIGLEYGPSFQNLTEVFHDGRGSNALGTVTVPDMSLHMPMQYHSPFIIHPAFLDACFHAVIPLRLDEQGAVVPTLISNIYISAGISQIPGEQFEIAVNVNKASQRQTVVSLSGRQAQEKTTHPELSVQIDGLTLTSLNGGRELNKSPIKKCMRPLLRPDPSFLTSELLSELCTHLRTSTPDTEREDLLLLEEMIYIIADRTLAEVSDISQLSPGNEDRAKLYRFLTRLREDVITGRTPHDVKTWLSRTSEERNTVWERVRNCTGDEGAFIALVGDHLPAFLRDEIDVLSVVTRNDALGRYYVNNIRLQRSCKQASTIVDLLAHQNPSLRVLEIGAGTGGATVHILETLAGTSQDDLPRFSSYHFTDISSGFFGPFQKKVSERGWGHLPIAYRKLDMETDPVEQGFDAESYDLIIAFNVLHATRNLERTMNHTRQLLKPGGTLVLLELMHKPYGDVHDLFGIFPGWWVAEEAHRKDSPLMDEEGWDQILQRTGFSGVKAAIWDTEDNLTHKGKTMVATAISQERHETPSSGKGFQIITGSGCPSSVVEAFSTSFESMGSVQAYTFENYVQSPELGRNHKHLHTIFLELGSSSILRNIDEASWEAIKVLVTNSECVMWVTRGACYPACTSPDLALASGLIRTLRTEIGGPLIHLDLDSEKETPVLGQLLKTVTDVYHQAVATYEQQNVQDIDVRGSPELEFIQRNGAVQLLRYTSDTAIEHSVVSRAGTLQPSYQSLSSGLEADRKLKAEIAHFGMLNSLYFDDDIRANDSLGANEVEIEVRATALNPRDVMIAMGQMDADDLGVECAGIVKAVGSAVDQSKIAIGDRVAAPADGAMSQYVRVPAIRAQHIPRYMTFADAAAMPIAFCTALHSIRMADVEAADTILIHAAAGGLGQALVQLCQKTGVRILATVSNNEKKRMLMDCYGIAEQDIFWSRDTSFEKGVLAATAGKGVNAVFNTLSGEFLRASMHCLAPWGRFVELGQRDNAVGNSLEMASLAKNVSFLTVDIISLLRERFDKGSELWESVMNMAHRQEIRPMQPIAIFALGDIENAMSAMQAGQHLGKILVQLQQGEMGLVVPQSSPRPSLLSDAAYVLVGGLGGIGRAFASVMVRHLGARHLIFISRSGASTTEAQDTIRDLQQLGAQITVITCDASNKTALKQELDSHLLPPIKGVIHLGLVIQNDLFRNMHVSKWMDSLKPKVEATWNLHTLLPLDMDFFIMLSSMAGILGTTSQAAYNAAGTFQDAFASFRNTQLGWPATTTLDLGMVVGVGYVADRADTHNQLLSQGYESIPETECLALIEACLPLRPGLQERFEPQMIEPGNIITGIWPARLAEKGSSARSLYSAPQFAHARQMGLLVAAASDVDDKVDVSEAGQQRIRETLPLAESMAEAEDLVIGAVVAKLASLLMLPEADIMGDSQSMSSYGLDSLVAVEMRTWVSSEIQVTVPILEFLGTQSVEEFCRRLARRSKLLRRDLAGK